jgi:polysaccharide biosynthesis/export protein
MMLRNLVFVAFVSLLLAACSSATSFKDVPPGANLGVADSPKQEIRSDYRLSPSDIIQIEVFDVDALNRTVQLDARGMISLPYIGLVPAAGKTAAELTMDLQNRYGEKYLRNPQISVLVKQARAETFIVDGSVVQPGVFTVSDKMSLIKAIAMARGLDPLANPKQVVVFRVVNDQRVAGLFNLNDIRAGEAPDPPIYANDTIVVASSTARRTLRDILGVTPLVSLIPLIP